MLTKYIKLGLCGLMFFILFGVPACESTQMREPQALTGDTEYEYEYEYEGDIEERSIVPEGRGTGQSMHGRSLQHGR